MSRLCTCGRIIPSRVTVDGVFRRLTKRKHCLVCVPFRGDNNRNAAEVAARGTSARTARFRRWQDKARRERKARLVGLLGGRCGRCGYDRCVAALEFHHRDPDQKRFPLNAENLLRRWEVVAEEAAKCDLLCANCHREVEDELWRAAMARAEANAAGE